SLGCSITLKVDVDEPKVIQKEITKTKPRSVQPNIEDIKRDTPDIETQPTTDFSTYESHPLVKAMMDRFSARIVKVDKPSNP
ncbi:MAG TPA: hypothetical protein PK402_10640, partial [Tepidisphaeraceae bacterium]|nr:hypothetical protein [Tepidisphaeraceae bacterium]